MPNFKDSPVVLQVLEDLSIHLDLELRSVLEVGIEGSENDSTILPAKLIL